MAKKVESDAIGMDGYRVQVEDMLKGGSGWMTSVNGISVNMETVKATYIVNCAGGYADIISRMIGDDSFQIKPRLGDYLLLNRNQVSIEIYLYIHIYGVSPFS
jgi:L-2-hydroxyglutarate oxidase LhgO